MRSSQALYIKQVTDEKIADIGIRSTVHAHRQDRVFLEGPYRGQVNGEIQTPSSSPLDTRPSSLVAFPSTSAT